MENTPDAVIVLAAGKGTRMRSRTAKVLHPLAGKSLLQHALDAARTLNPKHIGVVVRHQRDAVIQHLKTVAPEVSALDQDDIPGTGRAVQCALAGLKEKFGADAINGTIIITSGDVPLLEGETLVSLAQAHAANNAAVTVMTTRVANPHGYGRILRDPAYQGDFKAGECVPICGIVEERDASAEQRKIDEINAGIYAFNGEFLQRALGGLNTDNDQGELYLTDTIAAARNDGLLAQAFLVADTWQAEGCNDRAQLAQLHAEYNRRVIAKHQEAGVSIVDPHSTWIDGDVTIAQDARIEPFTILAGKTVIGADAQVGPFIKLVDVTVKDGEVLAGTANIVETKSTSGCTGATPQAICNPTRSSK